MQLVEQLHEGRLGEVTLRGGAVTSPPPPPWPLHRGEHGNGDVWEGEQGGWNVHGLCDSAMLM